MVAVGIVEWRLPGFARVIGPAPSCLYNGNSQSLYSTRRSLVVESLGGEGGVLFRRGRFHYLFLTKKIAGETRAGPDRIGLGDA